MELPGNNLNALIGPVEHCCAYALALIDSPSEQTAELCIGSDDGCAAWCNGTPVIDNLDAARGYSPDQDRGPITLRKGRNQLLVKIGQFGGGWGFGVRFAGLKHPLRCRYT